jgi:hypothetical protein
MPFFLTPQRQQCFRSNFLSILLSKIEQLHVVFGFQVMDASVDLISVNPKDAIQALRAILESNSKNQSLFIQTGHLAKILPPIRKGIPQSVRFLKMVFTDSPTAFESLPHSKSSDLFTVISNFAFSNTPE